MSRMRKVDALIHEQLGEIFSEAVEMPLDCLVTIKKVEVSPDLHTARVFVSIFPFGQRHRALRTLQKRIGFVQKELNRRVHLRYVPKISFVLDFSEEAASQIEQIIDSIDDTE